MSIYEEQQFVEEIAIVGMACHFPGAKNLNEFWENLKNGVVARREFSNEELLAAGIAAATLEDPNYVKAGYILDGVDQFDADFFGFSPRQAQLTDPQQRLFLECAWEALESAGVDPLGTNAIIGIYAGAAMNHYMLTFRDALMGLDGSANHLQWLIGNDKDYLAMQTAYKLNLRGPCINAQTACSTGLVLVHMACQSLLNYECDLAVAGSATILIPQIAGYFHHEDSIFSPDGYCRSFDAKGEGSAFGSGVGVVVLKRLSEAIAAGDHIWAVVKGAAVNNDGAHKVGFAAPSIDGQARVIAEAHAVAAVTPESISYIEAQGTATAIGDSMEFEALKTVFVPAGNPVDSRAPAANVAGSCALGAVKANVGHLQVAAGMAGLIKTALALYHGLLPPTPNFATPNPRINLENSPFYINTQLTCWPREELPRRAGVTAFGIGGTNAHLILEEAPPQATPGGTTTAKRGQETYYLLTLSAKSAAALRASAERYREFLETIDDAALGDICYTSHIGRSHFAHRIGVIGQTGQALRETLLAYLQGQTSVGLQQSDLLQKQGAAHSAPIASPLEVTGNERQRLETLSAWYVQGVEIEWEALHWHKERRKSVLPSYPFQRERYWVERQSAQVDDAGVALRAANANGSMPTPLTLHQQLANSESKCWLSLFVHYLQTSTAQILALQDPTRIDPARTLLQLGVDSLMMIELRNQLKKAVPTAQLPITLFLESSVQQIAALLEEEYLQTLLTKAPSPPATSALSPSSVASTETVEELAEEFIL